MFGNKFGANWRAFVAYICGIAPNLPGFIGDVGAPKITVSEGAMRLYYLGYPVGFFISAVIYLILCYFFPVPGTPVTNFLTEKGWFQKWAYVEDFEQDWKNELRRDDLCDDTVSIYDGTEEKIVY